MNYHILFKILKINIIHVIRNSKNEFIILIFIYFKNLKPRPEPRLFYDVYLKIILVDDLQI